MEDAQGGASLFRAESVGRSLSIYLPVTVGSRLIGLVRAVILAWLIGEAEFGLFQLALLAINVLNPLCSAGLNEAVARYVPQYETRGALRPYLRRIAPFVLVTGLVLSAVMYLAARPLGALLFATLGSGSTRVVTSETCTLLTQLAAGTTFGLIVYFLLLAILRGLRMFRAVSLIELVNNVAFTLLAILVALAGMRTAGAMIASYGLALLAIVVVVWPPLQRAVGRAPGQDGPLRPDGPDCREPAVFRQLLRFSLWAAMATIMWQTLQYYPMWYLQKLHGPEVTAVFGAVRSLTQIVLVAAVAIVGVVQTSVTKTWEESGAAEADRRLLLAYKAAALLMLVGCVAFALMGRPIMRVFPASYGYGAGIVALSLLFFLVGGHLSFLAVHFTLIERTTYLFWPWTVGVAANALAGYVLLKPGQSPETAVSAAAWTGVAAVSAALVTSLALMRRGRRSLDGGAWLLLAAMYILTLPAWAAAILCGLLVAAAIVAGLPLTKDERQQLFGYVHRAGEQMRRLFASRPDNPES